MKQPSMAEIERLAESALKAKLIMDEAEEQYEERKAAFEEALERAHRLNSDFKAVGNVKVDITANRFFDANSAFESLPKKVQKEVMVTKPDPKLVKAHLTPIQLETFMRSHANPYKIGLKVLED